MTRILTTLLLLAGCGTTPSTPDHGHDHDDGASGHAHDASGGHTPSTSHQPDASGGHTSPATPGPVSLGAWTATLEPGADTLRITATDASGAAVSPAGEIRVVLTGTGQEEQRVILEAGAEGWSGAARAAGAPGYTAVLSATVDGRTETARATWGQVPEVGHAHGGEHGHDHGQGEHAHGH